MDIVFNFTWLAAAAQLVGCCIDTGWLLHCNWLASSHLCEYHHFIACCMATAARPPLYHYTFAMPCIDVHKCLLHLLPSWLCCPNNCCWWATSMLQLLPVNFCCLPFVVFGNKALPFHPRNGWHTAITALQWFASESAPTTFCHSTAITEQCHCHCFPCAAMTLCR